MDSARVKENHNNNSKTKDEFNNYADNKVCVHETVIKQGFINEELHDTDNKQRSVHNYVTVINENIDDWTVAGLLSEKPCDTEYKQENIHNYANIKDKNIDDFTAVIPETELKIDCTDDKLCPNGTEISEGYIKQEPGGMEDEQQIIQNDLSIKDENIDDLAVVVQETELMTDCIDNKVCIYETIISKKEPCDMGDKPGGIHNNINTKDCEECGEKYDLYCLKCPMLIRIFDSNNPDGTDNTVRRTLPRNFIGICETQSGMGVVALRAIPKGVVFGPFKGLDSTKDEVVSKWKFKNKELAIIKDPKWSNWMQYIRRGDKTSHQNLVPFRYKERLYYRSKCHINVGDELLVRWDSDGKKGEIRDTEDGYWEPCVCGSLDDSYACTFCCVGYKSISHLKAHNSTCIEKRNKKDFCKEIVQCDICKIYLDKKEYSDYHTDRCYKSNGKCVFNSPYRRNRGRPHHNIDKPFSCTICWYKSTTKSNLKRHVALHNGDKSFAGIRRESSPYKATTNWILNQHIANRYDEKPFACTLCPYKTNYKSRLEIHIARHNGDKPFACTFCPYKAMASWILKQHSAIHYDDKPFACSLCPYKTTRKSCLKLHIARHNGDKPFACTLCPYKTTASWILKQHSAIHNGDKPFACALCSYKTKRKSLLKTHIAIHNDDKPFACTLCPYKTKTKSGLKIHVTSHNDDKRFACVLCPYKTTRKLYLRKHTALIHNGDKP